MASNFLLLIINVAFLVRLIRAEFSEDGCDFTSSAMFCQKKSGKFLKANSSAEVSSVYILSSDISALTREDFSKFTDAGLISIVNSTFTFPQHERLFSDIQDLRNIRIIDAQVTEEIGTVFVDNTNIMSLYLSGNKIETVRKSFLSHLVHAEEIDLSHNEITFIEVGVFDGLTSLRTLNLSHNKIGSSFDPNFLAYAPAKCAVCIASNAPEDCSEYHWSLCKNSEQYDQLWMIPALVSVHIQENPICLIVTGEVQQINSNQIVHSETIASKGRKSCKVYVKGHCFKHESRRMFLLEACGSKTIPSRILVGDDNTSSNSENEEIKVMSRAIFAQEVILYVILVVLGSMTLGVVFTICLLKKEIIFAPSLNKKSSSKINPEDSDTVVPLVTESRLHKAIIENDLSKIKSLLKANADPNIMDSNSDLPLNFAARMGYTHIIKELLRKGADIDGINGKGHAAIHSAIARGHIETVKFLIANGASVHIENKHGNSPLSQASKEMYTEIVRLLLDQGASVDHRNSFGEMPIHHAARNGRTDTLKLLIDKGSVITASDGRGYRPLHYAAKKGNLDIVRILLDQGESIHVRNSSDNTPLHKAAKNGHLGTVKFLLERKADATAINFKGQMPHDVAKEQNHTDCWIYLKEHVERIKATTNTYMNN